MSESNVHRQQNAKVVDLRFEHYMYNHRMGTQVTKPRLSWNFQDVPQGFKQEGYEIEFYNRSPSDASRPIYYTSVTTQENVLVPWPMSEPLVSRQIIFARVRAWGNQNVQVAWSEPASIEASLLERDLWKCERIASPWVYSSDMPQPEELFRKEFGLRSSSTVVRARLYITAQGLYEAEINGKVVGDQFLGPGWTVYDRRLQYQTFDVTEHLSTTTSVNCIGVRVAEGWFCGRLSFAGGHRNIWGDRPALWAQLEIIYEDGESELITTNSTWMVTRGPSLLAEIYNGEKYDARLEIPQWSVATTQPNIDKTWSPVTVLDQLPGSVDLVCGEAEPVRRIAVLRPVKRLDGPPGNLVLDFGQNLVGYTRIRNVKGESGQKITITHAEVLEKSELCTRPLRAADNKDEFTLRGSKDGESWEPRFTFHGYRYVQIDGWPSGDDPMLNIEAVVCHSDMKRIGEFSCSDPLINQLHENIVWSMKGNFVSIPTDCPQRDERLGWTGDLALFAPTACLLYDSTAVLTDWLKDVFAEQCKHGGLPPLVVPDALDRNGLFFSKVLPHAIWSDVTILAPWALYQATGDERILEIQYQSMVDWLGAIPRNVEGNKHLWRDSLLQLGDWLDPDAPPHNPAGGKTDAVLVSNAYLVHSLDLISQIASIIGRHTDAEGHLKEAAAARSEWADEYLTPSGRLMSDSQTAYTVAIKFGLIPSRKQRAKANERFSEIVRRNAFKIGTGFAGTPFICEALTLAGHPQIAYSMLLNKECPSWLYPVSMGATTIWERWDSMLPDGSVNPGEMTSFNHYALGSVATFMWERLAGLQRAAPGWKKSKIAPLVGGNFTSAKASLVTPYGKLSVSWSLIDYDHDSGSKLFHIDVVIPPNTSAELVFPEGVMKENIIVDSGTWSFSAPYESRNEWPIKPISIFP